MLVVIADGAQSMQHLSSNFRVEDVVHETATEDLLISSITSSGSVTANAATVTWPISVLYSMKPGYQDLIKWSDYLGSYQTTHTGQMMRDHSKASACIYGGRPKARLG